MNFIISKLRELRYIRSMSFYFRREYFYSKYDITQLNFFWRRILLFINIESGLIFDKKVRLAYNPNSDIGRYLFTKGSFEINEIKLISDFLKSSKEPVFIDIGANIGYHSIMLAKEISDLKVFSFEPGIEARRLLEENIVRNNIKNKQIKTYPIAIGESSGILEFYESEDNAYSSILKPTRKGVKNSYEIQVQSFDDWFESSQLTSFDLIKVDVEGYELAVVKGMFNTIQRVRPIIFIEIYSGNSDMDKCLSCFNLLLSSGYKAFVVSPDNELIKINDFSEEYYNYFFLWER